VPRDLLDLDRHARELLLGEPRGLVHRREDDGAIGGHEERGRSPFSAQQDVV
jgi:hypothetical protein